MVIVKHPVYKYGRCWSAVNQGRSQDHQDRHREVHKVEDHLGHLLFCHHQELYGLEHSEKGRTRG